MNKVMFLMDLQLFAGFFNDGEEPDYPNPLLVDDDDVPEVPPVPASEDVEDDIAEPPAGEPEEELVAEPEEEVYEEPEDEYDPAPQFDLDNYLSEIQQSIAELNSKLDARGQEDQQVSEEELKAAMEAENADFWERMQENPREAIMALAKEIAEEEIRPMREKIEQQEQMAMSEKQVNDFVESHPDMEEYVTEMLEILEKRPHLQEQPDALEIAYKMAKADKTDMKQKVAPQKSPDELLQDEAFIEKILQNENIRKKLMANNLQDIDKGKPPVVIGSERSGGKQPMSQPKRAQSIEEASAFLREALKQ